MKRFPAILFVALLITMVAAAGCSSKVKPGTSEVKRPEVKGITVTVAQKAMTADYYETSGTIKAKTVSALASKVMGTVTSVFVKEGDRVNAGQVLATLEDTDLSARAVAAQAGYREALKAVEIAGQNRSLAGTTYQRYQQLYNDKAISQQEMDQIETQKRVADLELERAQQSSSRAQAEAQVYYGLTQIISPSTGVVTAKKIDLGSTAVPGVPLFTVEDTAAYTFEADVDESLAGRLTVGMPADVLVSAAGKTVQGIISEIAPSIDPASRKFHIKLEVPGDGLKSGLYAKIRLPIGTKEALLLPPGAIVEKGQLTGVYVVDDNGVVTYRLVRLGKQVDNKVEIVSGLNPGEKVIVNGVEKAVDGGIVKEVTPQ
ncbi:MAG: efflux RND transporter periplasmic adaptor subunit [Negativicutes bacterium]|nr:efflux RND transporter periplasmic adaptor subunit [Negativicutes bacterium]